MSMKFPKDFGAGAESPDLGREAPLLHSIHHHATATPETPSSTKHHGSICYIWDLLVNEARAVSLWSLLAMFLRIGLVGLSMLAMCEGPSVLPIPPPRWFHQYPHLAGAWESVLTKELLVLIAAMAGWILALAPSKVATLQAPGFIFANPWLLLWVRDKTGVIPNVPVRVCEYIMGRLRLWELILILPIHVVTVVSTSIFLRRVLPESIVAMALEPIQYKSGGVNPWMVDMGLEVLVTAAFTVLLLVLPVVFQLNYVPWWVLGFLMYPLLSVGVDGTTGLASALAPNVTLALSILGHQPLPDVGLRLMGPVLGGMVGGRIMKVYFPDQPNMSK